MLRKIRKGVSFIFSLILLLMNSFFLLNFAYADGHFMDALAIVRLDGKIPAPEFTLKDLNGREVSLKDYRGKIVFLNFWATWCPPCRDEMPSMEKLYNEFRNKDFVILAIDLQESERRVKAFRDEFKLNFPILLDSDGIIGLAYGVRSIPTTYLVDREGYLIGGALGPRNWASKDAFGLINHLLNTSPGS